MALAGEKVNVPEGMDVPSERVMGLSACRWKVATDDYLRVNYNPWSYVGKKKEKEKW